MRPQKTTVDYFPHKTTSGRTIFVLENLYGNDGYAAWFKILEILGATSGHYYDYSSPANFQYLCAKLGVSGEKTLSILQTLAEVEAIDHDLHSQSVIWSENFCAGLDKVYTKRNSKRPEKPSFRNDNQCSRIVSGAETPQRKEEHSKGENKLPCANKSFEQSDWRSPDDLFDEFWRLYPKKKSKLDAKKAWRQVKGHTIFEKIIKAVKMANSSDPQWKKNGGDYIPFPATWLRAGGWDNEFNESCGFDEKITPRQKLMQDIGEVLGNDYEPIGGGRCGEGAAQTTQPLSGIGTQRKDHNQLGNRLA